MTLLNLCYLYLASFDDFLNDLCRDLFTTHGELDMLLRHCPPFLLTAKRGTVMTGVSTGEER